MKRLLALLVIFAAAMPLVAQPPAQAEPGPTPIASGGAATGPTRFEPGAAPPGPPRALLAAPAAAAGPAQNTLRCDQLLLDQKVSVDAPLPWREYRRQRLFSTDEAHSAPRSLSLRADRDGDPTSGPDFDAVGQEITVTTTLAELYGGLSYLYAAGTPAAGDELRVELYEIGKINASGLITTARVITAAERVAGSWQTIDWEVTDAASIARLRALGKAALVFTMVSGGSPGSTRLWLDDLTANSCVPAASIGGRVTRSGSGAAGALVLLVATDAVGASTIASTRATIDGSYSFLGVPVQPAGVSYRVWFLNQPGAPPRAAGMLGFWAGPVVPQLSEGGAQSGLDFEVGDAQLQTPGAYAEAVATSGEPAVLRWAARAAPRPGERHQVCLYDPARGDATTRQPAQVCGPIIDPSSETQRSFSLTPASFAGVPGFSFTYGRSYRWYVVVYAADPRTNTDAQYGYSFGERAITLLSEPAAEATPTPTPEPGDPTAGVAGADWTLLIYMAADNAIGDPQRAPGLGRPSGQLASLPTLAAAYPAVNLVSYVDRYGPGGAELCAYPAGGEADCRLRAEVDSAAPQTLAAFIAYGQSRYPAARTALLIVAPGQAAGRLALDETSAGAPDMSLAELQQAYAAAGLGGATKLDLVIYQAPLMGTAEALVATAPYARYMVASPTLIWQLGPYRELVPLLGGPERNDPAAVARGAVAAFATTVGAVGGVRANVWAAYDLGRAGALTQALEVLAEAVDAALTSEGSTTLPGLTAARAAAQSYDASGNGRLDSLETSAAPIALEEDALVDLSDLAAKLQAAVGPPDYVRQAAAGLAELLGSATASPVIAANARSGQSLAGVQLSFAEARGLGIFFPSGDRLGGQAALSESYLLETADAPPGDSLWAAMLRTYLAGVLGAGPGGVTESAGGGAQMRPLPGGFVSTTLYLPVLRR